MNQPLRRTRGSGPSPTSRTPRGHRSCFADNMSTVELIGVPFDGWGRAGNQARAAQVLREAGLVASMAPRAVSDRGDLVLPPPSARRGDETSLINETALVAMVQAVGEQVHEAVRAGRFPMVFGGDCTSLLGILPALPGVALLFVDGHEDTTPLDSSEDGEAANTEIGLLLGLTGRLLRGPLAQRLAEPTLERNSLAVLGPRDVEWRQRLNVASLRELGVWFRDWRQAQTDPAGEGRAAVRHLRRTAEQWWLHVDLDVLDPRAFPAQGVPGDPCPTGGLSWSALTDLLVAAIAAEEGGCVGLSVVIYDPEQDPTREQAAQIVAIVAKIMAAHQQRLG